MDETHDAMRTIRSRQHKLTLNLMPERPWCQYNRYKEASYPMLAEMNVLNLQGKLTPQQAIFFQPTKPPVELFDLTKDPHEVNNLADDPRYADVKAQLLKELEQWRKSVIKDQGVSTTFRAVGKFPEQCPVNRVDDWVKANPLKLDFNQVGWPGWYPTRSLADWQTARKKWQRYVFRGPIEKVKRPVIAHSRKKKRKK